MTFKTFDVVVTPFPYADRAIAPVRPGIILTDWEKFGSQSGIALVAMVTSARQSSWPYDIVIGDLASAGLPLPCKIRMKINAIAFNLIERRIGVLAHGDVIELKAALGQLLPGLGGT